MKTEDTNRTRPAGEREQTGDDDLFSRGEAALHRARIVSRRIAERVRRVSRQRLSEGGEPAESGDRKRERR
jgi:hypothetical protein